MTPNQIGLKLLELVRRDGNVGQLAEPRVDAVHRSAAADGGFDDRAARREAIAGSSTDQHFYTVVSRNPHHVSDREGSTVELERFRHGPESRRGAIAAQADRDPAPGECGRAYGLRPFRSSGLPGSVWNDHSRMRNRSPTWVGRTAPYITAPPGPRVSKT